MPPKEFRGPSNFCEWVVGTTIPTVLGPEKKPRKQKSTRREVIRVEVTTDDESGEDTLKISYPRSRSRRKKAAPEHATKLKKVRFEVVPKKSALKKVAKTYTISDSSEEDEKASDSSADASSDSSNARVIVIPENNIKVHTVKLSDESKTDESSGNDSDADSDPSPTCKCIDCIHGRQKLAKRMRRAALLERLLYKGEGTSDSGTDDSDEANKGHSKGKNKKKDDENKAKENGNKNAKKKKQKPEVVTVETDESESEAKDDADDESNEAEDSDDKKTQKKQKQGQNQDKKQKHTKKDGGKKQADKQQDGKKEDKDKKKSEGKGEKDESSGGQKKEEKAKDKSKAYPKAMPGPNPRRPNLIEPIRAEVVQTERVIESQEDPPPNAYYDHANNVLRVYHGPVYGGHHNRSLYPIRDPNNLSLPLGTAHPVQNPYFHGFSNAPLQPPQQGQENKVGAQWPGGTWPGMQWPYAPPCAPAPGAPGAPPPVNGSKGAFSDRAGRNNVAPAGVEDSKPANPYYNGKKQQTSPFRSYNKGSPPYAKYGTGSKAGSRQASASRWNNDGAPGSVKQSPQNSGWDQNATGVSQTQGAATWGGSQTQQQTGGWDSGQTQQETPQNDAWGGSGQQDQPAQNGWDNYSGQGDQTWGDQQQNTAESNDVTPESNVMPGTFSGWGDPTMAADTKGLVDIEAPEPKGGW